MRVMSLVKLMPKNKGISWCQLSYKPYQFRFLGMLLASQARIRAALGTGSEVKGGQVQPLLCKGNAWGEALKSAWNLNE